jgi:hypothetical protein
VGNQPHFGSPGHRAGLSFWNNPILSAAGMLYSVSLRGLELEFVLRLVVNCRKYPPPGLAVIVPPLLSITFAASSLSEMIAHSIIQNPLNNSSSFKSSA